MKSAPIRVGITGGIGAGKSVVCDIFKVLGVQIYDADSRAKILMTDNPDLVAQIKDAFGSEAYDNRGRLNRQYLAGSVFNNAEKLRKLNGLVHPAVGIDFEHWCSKMNFESYVLKEAALIVESGSYKSLDAVITVVAPESLRIKRVLQRDSHRTPEDIRAIISRQLDDQKKVEVSKFVVVNDEKTLLLPQVLKIHEYFNNLRQTG